MNKFKSLLLIVAVCLWSNANELDSLPSFGISAYIGDVQAYFHNYSDDWLPSIEIPINLRPNVIIQPGISYQFTNIVYNDTLGNQTGDHYFKLQPSIAAYLRLNKNTNPNIFTGVKLKYIYISSTSGDSNKQWGQICALFGLEYFLRKKISLFTQCGLLLNIYRTTYAPRTFYDYKNGTVYVWGVYWPGLGIKLYF